MCSLKDRRPLSSTIEARRSPKGCSVPIVILHWQRNLIGGFKRCKGHKKVCLLLYYPRLKLYLVWRSIESLHALSTSRHLPDVWAINSGTFYFNVSKTTYEGLGVQGGKVHEVFKGKGVEEQYRAFLNISVPSDREN